MVPKGMRNCGRPWFCEIQRSILLAPQSGFEPCPRNRRPAPGMVERSPACGPGSQEKESGEFGDLCQPATTES